MTEAKQLMAGKRGVVMGVANDHSIAWGIARTLAAHGAEIAFTYQGDAQLKRLKPLAASIGATMMLAADVEDDAQLDAAFAEIGKAWGGIDFLVHAIAFSDKNELKGRYVETSRANFQQTLSISCYSFTAVAQRAAKLMAGRQGSMITLSYLGARQVMPSYNVMGVAKAALEASVRYLAADLGADAIRVNAISAGPIRTLAGSVVGGGRTMFRWIKGLTPLKKTIELDHLGGSALYLLSDLSAGVTGEVHYVDAGYNVMGVPPASYLEQWAAEGGKTDEGSEG
jgi:enoyl-[acyl-carrier protein] reductase I